MFDFLKKKIITPDDTNETVMTQEMMQEVLSALRDTERNCIEMD